MTMGIGASTSVHLELSHSKRIHVVISKLFPATPLAKELSSMRLA
jgi:hypothetical protein